MFMWHRNTNLARRLHGYFSGYLVAMGYLNIMAHCLVNWSQKFLTMGFGHFFTMSDGHFFGRFNGHFTANLENQLEAMIFRLESKKGLIFHSSHLFTFC